MTVLCVPLPCDSTQPLALQDSKNLTLRDNRETILNNENRGGKFLKKLCNGAGSVGRRFWERGYIGTPCVQ